MRFEGRTWTVAALVGGQVRLTAENGEMAALLLSLLFAGEGFEVVDGPAARRVAPLGLLDSLPATVRERALAWEGHVREVETGHPGGSGEVGPARAEYNPEVRTLAQREEAKAAELSAAGLPTSAVTVRRMRPATATAGCGDWWISGPLGRGRHWGVRTSGWWPPCGRYWRPARSAPAGRWGGFGCIPGGCWPSGTASGRWRCRRLRRSTGWCTPWPTARAAGHCATAPLALGAAGSSVRTDDGDGAG